MIFSKVSNFALIGVLFIGLSRESAFGWINPSPLHPERCAEDSLPQWDGGEQSILGTSRGRNEWLKLRDPKQYDLLYRKTKVDGLYTEKYKKQDGAKWVDTRRVYPTFGTGVLEDENGNIKEVLRTDYRAPTDPSVPYNVPEDQYFIGVCESGCVTPEQRISDSISSQKDILGLRSNKADKVIHLDQLTSSGDPVLSLGLVDRYTSDDAPAKQTIAVFELSNGNILKTSLNHPLVTFDGYMRNAETLKAGDQLIGQDGERVTILEASQEPYFGKLYNLTLQESRMDKSVYVVEGVLSGDKKYQNEWVSFINHKVLRENMGEDFLNNFK